MDKDNSYSLERPCLPVNNSCLNRLLKTKPIEVIEAEEKADNLPRQLKLFDLLCIGIGGTIGTGIFATTAEIIQGTAGPSALVSWIVGGVACALSGVAYMELTSRIPSSGSCYAYTYHTIGELPAFIAGGLLTLEYGVSGAGVARSWASKVHEWAIELSGDSTKYNFLNFEHFNLMGFVIQFAAVLLLLSGLRLGKLFINAFTIAKVFLVLFMIIGGFCFFDIGNIQPFVPPSKEDENGQTIYGYSGVVLGATQAFFGYVGFDEVCCLAAEAKNPRKIMPKAVLGVVIGTGLLSALASFALSGMQPYYDIKDFPSAFVSVKQTWAGSLVRVGEILAMPVVVLVAFLAQPRLFYAMSIDGLLPKVFSLVDKNRNLFWNTLITGSLFSIIALLVPFDSLWDLVDFGVLLSFNITNSALVLIRMKEIDKNQSKYGPMFQLLFFILSGCSIFCLQKGYLDKDSTAMGVMAFLLALICFVIGFLLWKICNASSGRSLDYSTFRAPLVPFIPCIAITFNWYLISQMHFTSLLYGFFWIIGTILIYFMYGFWYSVGQNTGWKEALRGAIGSEDHPSLNEVRPSIAWMYSDDPNDPILNNRVIDENDNHLSDCPTQSVKYNEVVSPSQNQLQ